MRGLRGLAGALALAVLAGEVRAQYYPYTPYPQPNPYGYGGYSAYPPSAYSPIYPYASQGQAYQPAPTPSRPQGMGPPIFQQTPPAQLPSQQPPAPAPGGPPLPTSRYFGQPGLPPQALIKAPTLVPSAQNPALAPQAFPATTAQGTERPIVIPAVPLNPPSYPRSLPSDPKAKLDAPARDARSQAAVDGEGEADGKNPLKPDNPDEAAAVQDQPEEKPRDTVSRAPSFPGLGAPVGNTGTSNSVLALFQSPSPNYVPRIWGTAEYLVWWEKSAPVGVPLVTSNATAGAAPVPAIGAIGEPGTQIIFGLGSGQSVNFNAFSGGRFFVGSWLDPESIFGLEGGGFVLERRNAQFNAGSAGGAAPIVSIPFFATEPFGLNPAGETSLNAGLAPNTVSVANYSHLWGFEANALLNLSNNQSFRLVGLVGFRYVNLTESLVLTDQFFDPTTSGTATVQDGFGTQNHFWGGQVGLRGGTNWGRFSFDGSAKVAFGDNSQYLNIAGLTSITNGAFGLTSSNAGVFAEPSNIGRYHRDQFSIIPEFTFNVGYLLTQNVRPFIGYNFLYFSRVLRPGDQIDRAINPTEQPTFGGTGGTTVGFPAPTPSFHNSDFWAQGLNFGFEIRY